MRRLISLIILLLSCLQVSAESPVNFKLRSSYTYKYFFMDIYKVELYSTDTAYNNILENVPRKLEFKYYRDLPASLLIEKSIESLNNNPQFNISKFKAEVDKVHNAYQDIRAGDVYELSYIPQQGTTLKYNSKEIVSIPGTEFAKFYFAIWLSEYSFDRQLARNLLAYKNPANNI